MHLQGYGIAQWSDASFELLLTRYKKEGFSVPGKLAEGWIKGELLAHTIETVAASQLT